MNGDDPMLGSQDERDQYLQEINDMIAQDVEQSRQQRISEFQQTRDTKAVIVGVTGAEGLIGAVSA